MSDFIKRQDVLAEMKAEVAKYGFNEDASSDSLIEIVSEAQGYISNEHYAQKIVKALENEAQRCDKIMVGLGKAEDRYVYVQKAEAYRYAKQVVVDVLAEVINHPKEQE